MTYTSGFHFFIRFGLAFIGLGVGILVGWLLWVVAAFLGLPAKYEIAPFLLGFGIVVVVWIKLTDRYQGFLDAIAAYLYIREELETPVSFQESKQLSFLFAGDAEDKWYPLSHVRELPKAERKQYLLDVAASFKDSQ